MKKSETNSSNNTDVAAVAQNGKHKESAAKEIKSRYIKPVIFNSVNDVDKIEERVNVTVDEIKTAGGKIISINSQLFGISPMNLIYNIIYEREQALPPTKVEGE